MSKKHKKHLYTIVVPVRVARGNQTYEVEAYSEDEALDIHNNGNSKFVSEEIEVLDSYQPEIIDEGEI